MSALAPSVPLSPLARRPLARGPLARRAVQLVLALVAAVLVLAPLATLADDVTWSVEPGPEGQSTGRGANLAWIVQPGQVIQDSVVVTNYSSGALHLAVGAKDAVTTADGNLDLRLAEDPNTGVGSWIQVDTDVLDIAPGQSATVPFTLTVPADAAPGDYSGGIVTTYSAPGTNVSVDNRVAARVDVRVAGDIAISHAVSGLDVSIPSTWSPSGRSDAALSYTLRNTGNARIYVQERVTVSGPFGIGKRVTESTLQEVLPGSTVTRTVTVDSRALLRDRIEVETRAFGVDETPGNVQTQQVTRWAIPYTQLLILLGVIAVAVVLGIILGRRRGGPARAAAAAPAKPTATRAKDAPRTPGSAADEEPSTPDTQGGAARS